MILQCSFLFGLSRFSVLLAPVEPSPSLAWVAAIVVILLLLGGLIIILVYYKKQRQESMRVTSSDKIASSGDEARATGRLIFNAVICSR